MFIKFAPKLIAFKIQACRLIWGPGKLTKDCTHHTLASIIQLSASFKNSSNVL